MSLSKEEFPLPIRATHPDPINFPIEPDQARIKGVYMTFLDLLPITDARLSRPIREVYSTKWTSARSLQDLHSTRWGCDRTLLE